MNENVVHMKLDDFWIIFYDFKYLIISFHISIVSYNVLFIIFIFGAKNEW